MTYKYLTNQSLRIAHAYLCFNIFFFFLHAMFAEMKLARVHRRVLETARKYTSFFFFFFSLLNGLSASILVRIF